MYYSYTYSLRTCWNLIIVYFPWFSRDLFEKVDSLRNKCVVKQITSSKQPVFLQMV